MDPLPGLRAPDLQQRALRARHLPRVCSMDVEIASAQKDSAYAWPQGVVTSTCYVIAM